MTPLRIAYVLPRPPSYSETFIDSEVRAVRAAGATVEVFVVPTASRATEAARTLRASAARPLRTADHVHTLGLSYLPRALLANAYAAALAPDVAAFAPHVVHAHFVNLPTATAVLVARDLGRPVTAMAHAADFLLDRNPAALRRRLHRLSHLFVIAAATGRQLADTGVPMSAIPHSVVRASFDGRIPARPDRPRNPATRLVSIARLVEKKGIDTALDAVARLVAAGHEVRYDIYGDGPLRERLTRQARSSGIDGAVTFHGAVPHAVATQALAAADIAVLPCRRGGDGDLDGIPVFLMEAAGRGVPVVTTAVSGIPELSGDDGCWLVPPGEPGALAATLIRVVDEPAEARRRADALRHRIRTEFSPALQAERLLATWHRIASGAPWT